MGLGKTTIVLSSWDINFRAVLQVHRATLKAKPLSSRNPLQWPPLVDRKLNGNAPKIGATFISANLSSIRTWAKTWKGMFGGDAAHANLEEKWRLKMVILYSSGEKLAAQYGGAKAGIYSSLSDAEWAELCPVPRWDKDACL